MVKDIRIIQNIYYNQYASLPVGYSETKTFNINNGVARGCILSIGYFNLYSENTFKCIYDLERIKIKRKNVKNTRYADVIVTMATLHAKLLKLVIKVE